MSNPKRHHFVPQFILRRFVDHNGKLYSFDKRIHEKGVLAQTPEGLFVKKHLYSTIDVAGNREATLETHLSSVESVASTIIEKIIETARSHQNPKLTHAEKELWNQFFYLQWKRVPESFSRRELVARYDTYLEESLAEFESHRRPLTGAEHAHFRNPHTRDRLYRNASIMAVAEPGVHVQEARREKGLGVALIEKPNKSFIIGSFPIVRFANGGNAHLASPTVQIWFPIASDVAVTPIFPRDSERLVIINDKNIRSINEAIFRQSTLIAGRSQALVASLSRFFCPNLPYRD